MTAPNLTPAQRAALEASTHEWSMQSGHVNTLAGLVRRGLLETIPSLWVRQLYRLTPAGEALRKELKSG